MSRIFVHGLGAVTPAGWGIAALSDALAAGTPLPTETLTRPGWEKPLTCRRVPTPATRAPFLAHPRLRRASAISHFTVAAAIEAMGGNPADGHGIVVCMLAGSVAYSRRFYEEVLRDPASASPLIFPETVFNAPASHLAAFLGTAAINYTLVGDEGAFLEGLALAADWLDAGKVESCLVIGVEELDWIVADAIHLFNRTAVHTAGAGALWLKANAGATAIAELVGVTDSFSFTQDQPRAEAARKMRAELPGGTEGELLCSSARGIPRADNAEAVAWRDWSGPRVAPKPILGEGLVAGAAWQCVTACEAIRRRNFNAVNVSVVGASQQAIGARFTSAV